MDAEVFRLSHLGVALAWGAGFLLWLAWAGAAAYLLVLVLVGIRRPPRNSNTGSGLRRFCVLIPAHDEELLLGPVIDALHGLDYPADRLTTCVIADNCTDETADLARHHGAEVLERHDASHLGKGYALEWALAHLLQDERRFDAFVVIDADSVLNTPFLQVMNQELAAGYKVIQGRYDVLNAMESWRTRLMTCALALVHGAQPQGRRALGLSDGLKGNGMCFAREVLEAVPWSGESVTEDIDYTFRLVRAGYRITYSPDAIVRAQMPVTSRQAASQRERWEGGRYRLVRSALSLLSEGLRRGRPVVVDRAIDLLIPPLAEFLAIPVLLTLVALGAHIVLPTLRWPVWMALGWSGVLIVQVAYVALGLFVARVPLAAATALVAAPAYMVWKFALYGAMAVRGGPGTWRRTERRAMADADSSKPGTGAK